MVHVVYRLAPGEGPEEKTIHGGWDFKIMPNVATEIEDRHRARALVESVGGKKSGIQYATPADKALAEMSDEEFAAATPPLKPAEPAAAPAPQESEPEPKPSKKTKKVGDA